MSVLNKRHISSVALTGAVGITLGSFSGQAAGFAPIHPSPAVSPQDDDGGMAGGVQQELEIRRQRTLAEFDAGYTQAEAMLRQDDFDAASQAILTARVRLDENRDVLREAEYATNLERSQEMMNRIARARDTKRLANEAAAQEQAQKEREEALIREQKARQAQITQSLQRARQLQMEQKYDQALQVAEEVLFIDPRNDAALLMRDVLTSVMLYQEYVSIEKQRDPSYNWHTNQNLDATIAPRPNLRGPGMKSTTSLMQYPEDWPVVSLRRVGEVGYQDTPENRRVAMALAEARTAVDFNNNTLEQVIAFFNSVTGMNIYVDYRALDTIGINRQSEVTLQLNETNVATALQRVLEQLGDDTDRPEYEIQDGLLTVSSRDALSKRKATVVYDIRDLLFEVPYFDNAPTLDIGSALGQGGSGGGGGGGGGGGRGGGGGGGSGGGGGGNVFGTPGAAPERQTRQELVEQIVNIIQENVDNEGWRELGGDRGTLQELNGNLIITNTPRNHQLITGLLSQLREIRALQINVESRFLKVSTDWFEQIGIDLDLYFNTNNTLRNQQRAADPTSHLSDLFDGRGRLADPFFFGLVPDGQGGTIDRIPFGNTFGVPSGTVPFNAPSFTQGIEYVVGPVGTPLRTESGFAPIGMVQNSYNTNGQGLVNQLADFDLASFAGIATTASPAFALGVQFLDDVQVDLMIEATQADRRSVILTAPRITFFNGQRAWVAVATQTLFVSALDAVTSESAVAFEPTLDPITEGAVLDIEGVISADRRYVTMTVIAGTSDIIEIRQIEFQAQAAGGGLIGGVAGAPITSSIEAPSIAVQLVQTTVSVPDRGTVLLGGQRRVNETEVEVGVPILSKIPWINRFFTNRVTSKTEETLLILIRPEVIIQQENEDILFPGLSDQLGGARAFQ